MLEREEGASSTLRQLGATVRTLDLWDDPVELIQEDDDELEVRPRALVFEALDRPDLAVAALRAVRKEPYFPRHCRSHGFAGSPPDIRRLSRNHRGFNRRVTVF